LGTQRVLALVAGGVGVVGLGIGAVLGLAASSKKSDAQRACPDVCATEDGVSKWNSAISTAQAADVMFVVGGVGLAGGAVLWFTAKRPAVGPPSAQVGFGLGSLHVKGAF
jgi:hypothetical protein